MPTTMMMLAGWSDWTRPARRWVLMSVLKKVFLWFSIDVYKYSSLTGMATNIKSDFWCNDPGGRLFVHLYLFWCCTFDISPRFPDCPCCRPRLREGLGVRPRCPGTAPWSSVATTARRTGATSGWELRAGPGVWPWPWRASTLCCTEKLDISSEMWRVLDTYFEMFCIPNITLVGNTNIMESLILKFNINFKGTLYSDKCHAKDFKIKLV